MTDPRTDSLDAYLDELLDEEGRRALEQRLEGDAALRDDVQLQRRIDASLRKMVGGGDAGALGDRIRRARAQRPAPGRFQSLATMQLRPAHAAVIAATLLLAVLGTWWLWPDPPRPSGGGGYGYGFSLGPPVTLSEFYDQHAKTNLTGCWVCPPPRLARTFRDRFGRALHLGPAPAGIRVLGLRYAHTLSDQTVAIFARVDGKPAIVFVDRASKAPENLPAPGPGLHLHRRRIGDLAAIEISPFERPRLLGMLRDGEPPESPSPASERGAPAGPDL